MTVIGDNNTIDPDLKNVFVFGDNVTVTKDNIFYVRGTFLNVDTSGNTVQNKTNDFSLGNGIEAYTVDTSVKDITITPPATPRTGRPWIIKKTKQANKIIFMFTSDLINGEKEIVLKSKHASFDIWYDGITWHIK